MTLSSSLTLYCGCETFTQRGCCRHAVAAWLEAERAALPESMLKRFQDEGILVWGYDAAKGRTVVVTAVQDDQAALYYDINELAKEMTVFEKALKGGKPFPKAVRKALRPYFMALPFKSLWNWCHHQAHLMKVKCQK